MKNKFCRDLLSLTFLVMLFLHSPAQQKALKIGDSIPEQLWTTPMPVVNSPQKTIELNKDRDKLILLDFWNTWCSACLKGFPKMEDLQQKYGDRIKIVAVSSQDRATLEKFFATKNGQRFKRMLSVTDDQLFKKLFPHVGVPFIVWIKDGKLLNTTDGEQVNEKTIGELLTDSGISSLQTVIQHDEEGPLMLSQDINLEKEFALSNYIFFGKGRMRGLGFGSKFHRNGDIIYGRQFTNLSLAEMYSIITDEIFQKRRELFSDKRVIREIKATESFDNPKKADGTFEGSQLYSYDFIVPLAQAGSLYEKMFSYLNLVSDYTANIEKRTVPCLVLCRTSAQDKLATKGDSPEFMLKPSRTVVKNATLHSVANSLNGFPEIALPIVDETGYSGKIDMQMGDISTLPKLRKELARFDLDVVESTRSLEMLVIRDKGK